VRIRAVTFNVHGYRGGIDAVAEVLTRVRPDVVCLQECGSRRAVHRLAGALGMEVVSTHRPFGRVRNAVLFALPWEAKDQRVQELSREGGALRRGSVAVTLAAHGLRIAIASVHLGLSANERARHAAELTEALAAGGVPTIVGADLNEEPTGQAVRGLAERLFDTYGAVGEPPGNTFPARRPTDRIDYVFASAGFRANGAWVPSDPSAATASDHLPVVVDLELD
jgi:endonuclease/exonuclease/phosphatase family metal-dependent hydrolase